MKHILIASLLLTAAASVHAEKVSLVNADASPLSEMCIAAVESKTAALDVGSELGVTVLDYDKVMCNGMPISQFVRMYRATEKKALTSYTFKSEDESSLSKLCIAAVKSESEFEAMKEQLKGEFFNVETEVLCNNMTLQDFARKYRARAMTASIQ